MKRRYVFDACSLIAYINDEDGADIVDRLLSEAFSGGVATQMGKVNLLEVYYGVLRDFGLSQAEEVLKEISAYPIQIIHDISDSVFREAGKLKARYKLSLADALALGLASVSGDILVTADHHEMDIIEQQEKIKFLWIR
ncbi:MAG: PIN domain-containing protein [Oscillospiraceae bacterium]|nr:PIN domain-containing protein [Oscillospiraceae bacterium]